MSYILNKETEEAYWIYAPKQTFFRKRIVFPEFFSRKSKAKYKLFSIWREWYDNQTREFFSEEEVLITFNEILEKGWAIYDWKNRKLITPTDEAAKKALNVVSSL